MVALMILNNSAPVHPWFTVCVRLNAKKKKKKINTDWNEWALVNDVTGQNTKLSCDYENLSDALDVSPWTRSLIDWKQDLSKLHARAQISEASCQGNG